MTQNDRPATSLALEDLVPDSAMDGEMVWQREDSVKFQFTYMEIPVTARYEKREAEGLLDLAGLVGTLPYSSESRTARVNVQAILDAANDSLGPVFVLTADHQILLEARRTLDAPVTTVGVLACLASVLCRLEPYLECIRVFLAPPASPQAARHPVQPAWRGQ